MTGANDLCLVSIGLTYLHGSEIVKFALSNHTFSDMSGELENPESQAERIRDRQMARIDSPVRRIILVNDDLVRKFSWNLDYYAVTGFQKFQLQRIVEESLQNIRSNRRRSIPNSDIILLTVIWLRNGITINKISVCTCFKPGVLSTAIQIGLESLSKQFVPKAIGGIPKGGDLLQEAERRQVDQNVLNSQFIVDGKHFGCAVSGSFEERKKYYSYKLDCPAMQFQCVISHMGQAVFVSPVDPAAVPDITSYRKNRINMLATLAQVAGDDILILADSVYRQQEFHELVPKWKKIEFRTVSESRLNDISDA